MSPSPDIATEGFNDWGGRGYNDFIPGRSQKQPLPGIGLHDLLHGRQACPEFIAFDQGVGQRCPRAIFVPFPPKTGTNLLHPLLPSIVERVDFLEEVVVDDGIKKLD